MVESPVIRFRVKPEMKTTISVLQKEWQFGTQTEAVVHLINLGIIYVEDRKRQIQKLRDRLVLLKVAPHELRLPKPK